MHLIKLAHHKQLTSCWIVDMYNVLNCSHLLPDSYSEIGTIQLANLFSETITELEEIKFICDGMPKPNEVGVLRLGEVIYSKKKEADDWIEDFFEKTRYPKSWTVISSDHRVQRAARTQGGKWIDSQSIVLYIASQIQSQMKSKEKPTELDIQENIEDWLDIFSDGSTNTEGTAGDSSSKTLSQEDEELLRVFSSSQ